MNYTYKIKQVYKPINGRVLIETEHNLSFIIDFNYQDIRTYNYIDPNAYLETFLRMRNALLLIHTNNQGDTSGTIYCTETFVTPTDQYLAICRKDLLACMIDEEEAKVWKELLLTEGIFYGS